VDLPDHRGPTFESDAALQKAILLLTACRFLVDVFSGTVPECAVNVRAGGKAVPVDAVNSDLKH
jgi:hypothetical protein